MADVRPITLRCSGSICPSVAMVSSLAGRTDHLDRRDEAIALTGNRLDERGGVRRIAQRLADLADGGINARLDVDEDIFAPQAIDDVGAEYELTAALDEQNEKVHGLALEPDTPPLAAQLVASDVELEVAKAKRLVGIERSHCPGWQFPRMP
jgi:hypothetical protein